MKVLLGVLKGILFGNINRGIIVMLVLLVLAVLFTGEITAIIPFAIIIVLLILIKRFLSRY